MVDVLELAQYLLYLDREKNQKDGEDAASDITPLKLQKLLYYCQGYALGLYEEPLFGDTIEAWDNGPVIRRIYHRYQDHGSSCIPFDGTQIPELDDRAKKVAQLVTQDKGRYSAWALREMTHKETPWIVAFGGGRNTPIQQEVIKQFFNDLLDDEDDSPSFINAGIKPTAAEWEGINRHVVSMLHG